MTASWVGQYCIYVTDLERSVKFYEALGLQNTSLQPRTVDVELSIENTLVKVREARLPAAQMRTPDGSVPRPAVEKPPEQEQDAPDAKPRVLADNERQGPPPKPALVPATGGIVFVIERTEGGIVAARIRSRSLVSRLRTRSTLPSSLSLGMAYRSFASCSSTPVSSYLWTDGGISRQRITVCTRR